MRRARRGAAAGPGGFVAASALDAALPEYDVSSHHEIEIAAPRERAWAVLLEADLAGSAVSKALLALRGYGLRVRRVRAGGSVADRLQSFGFTKLAEVPGEELVFGLAGRFWLPAGGLERLAGPEDFRAFANPECVKAAWNLRVVETGPGTSRLTTETRVLGLGDGARRRFRIYWTFVGPFSGLIRRMLLRGVRRSAEEGGPATRTSRPPKADPRQ